MEASKVKHNSIVSDIWFFIRHYYKHEPFVLVFCGIEIILGASSPLLMIYLPKIAIDLVEQRAAVGHAMLVLGGWTLLAMLVCGVKNGIQDGKYNLYNLQRTNFMGMLFLKSLRIRYADQESGEIKKCTGKSMAQFVAGIGVPFHRWCAKRLTCV